MEGWREGMGDGGEGDGGDEGDGGEGVEGWRGLKGMEVDGGEGGGYGIQNFPTDLSHNKSIMAFLTHKGSIQHHDATFQKGDDVML